MSKIKNNKLKVFIGMSGGVDPALKRALLASATAGKNKNALLVTGQVA